MHEFSIAESILKAALAESGKHGGRRIASLGIRLGKASHLEPESLEFCLKAQAKGTIAENARIGITPVDNEPDCPEALAGSEVFLESIEID